MKRLILLTTLVISLNVKAQRNCMTAEVSSLKNSSAVAINNRGEAIITRSKMGRNEVYLRKRNGSLRRVAAPAGLDSVTPIALSNRGDVLVTAYPQYVTHSAQNQGGIYLYRRGNTANPVRIEGLDSASGFDHRGRILGSVFTHNDSSVAARTDGDKVELLDNPRKGRLSSAIRANPDGSILVNRSFIINSSDAISSVTRAVIVKGKKSNLIQLESQCVETPCNEGFEARDMNRNAWVVGGRIVLDNGFQVYRAALSRNGIMELLGVLSTAPGLNTSLATATNRRGLIVGQSNARFEGDIPVPHGVIFNPGQPPTDLNSLIIKPELEILSAEDISDRGMMIAAIGVKSGQYRALILDVRRCFL